MLINYRLFYYIIIIIENFVRMSDSDSDGPPPLVDYLDSSSEEETNQRLPPQSRANPTKPPASSSLSSSTSSTMKSAIAASYLDSDSEDESRAGGSNTASTKKTKKKKKKTKKKDNNIADVIVPVEKQLSMAELKRLEDKRMAELKKLEEKRRIAERKLAVFFTRIKYKKNLKTAKAASKYGVWNDIVLWLYDFEKRLQYPETNHELLYCLNSWARVKADNSVVSKFDESDMLVQKRISSAFAVEDEIDDDEEEDEENKEVLENSAVEYQEMVQESLTAVSNDISTILSTSIAAAREPKVQRSPNLLQDVGEGDDDIWKQQLIDNADPVSTIHLTEDVIVWMVLT